MSVSLGLSIALLASAASSSIVSLSQSEPAAAPPAMPQAEELPQIDELQLDRDRYERLTVPVTIDGQGPFRFFIDTGAQATVITKSVTDALSLEPNGRALLIAMGSSRVVETVELDGLEFADRSFNGLVAPLLESAHIGADGILGLDSLQDLRVLIDFRGDRMAVADAETLGGNRGFEIVVRARPKLGQMIITDARLNGIKTAVIIDTGAQNSVGNLALLRKLRGRSREKMMTTDVHGTRFESDLAYAKSLTIGGLRLSNIPIGFANSPAIEALGFTEKPALILGMRNLSLFERIAIDFSSRKILFDLPKSASSDSLIRTDIFASRIKS